MSKLAKFSTMVLIAGMVVLSAACASDNSASQKENPAEETLQAIYAEQTMQAQASADAAAAEQEAAVAPEAEEVPTVPPVEPEAAAPLLIPGEPPDPERTLEDSDSSIRAYENRTLSGDNILNNLYERPFTAREMIYQPELDIYTVDFAYEGDFFYYTITLNSMDVDSSTLYGIEFDRTRNGRGDLLVLTEYPGGEWSMDKVIVQADADEDVGGPQPMIADADYSGNGYDTEVTLEGEKLAFARISPDDPQAVQIAVSLALLDNPLEFLWGAWVDSGLQNFSMFDYNDAIGPGEAGSPLKDSDDYPIKALYSLDNTCRLPFGFEQASSTVPGTCINVPLAAGCKRYCVELCATGAGCCKWGCK